MKRSKTAAYHKLLVIAYTFQLITLIPPMLNYKLLSNFDPPIQNTCIMINKINKNAINSLPKFALKEKQ